MSSLSVPKVVPAQLSFLAIYNPALGNSDETLHNQIVFYYSKSSKAQNKYGDGAASAGRDQREEENEKLRQVGLAQGIMNFARSFSNGQALDCVETQKTRTVVHELELGWWILASIDLTQLPSASSSSDAANMKSPGVEYSSREVAPSALLLQQLACAHRVFLLHHGPSLQDLYIRLDTAKFSNILNRYWTRFATSWDALLHGSPAVDIFGGIKLAAGGELGIGVGEEEWGSGEREVLEDYARRTEGLVDIVVSRFGEPAPHRHSKQKHSQKASKPDEDLPDDEPWLGAGKYPEAADGVVFSGVGALSRSSLRDLSHWTESIYAYGEYAYGIRDNPSSDRKRRRRRNQKSPDSRKDSPNKRDSSPSRTAQEFQQKKKDHEAARSPREFSPGIPPPIVTAVESSLNEASSRVEAKRTAENTSSDSQNALSDAETWMKYLKLGYGTMWGGRGESGTDVAKSSQEQKGPDNDLKKEQTDVSMRYVEPQPHVDEAEERRRLQVRQESTGYFIVGLKGDIEDDGPGDEDEEGDSNVRIQIRTVYLELNESHHIDETGGLTTPLYEKDAKLESSNERRLTRLRPVIYIHRPFIFTFLFEPRAESLTFASFYRNMHTYFSPLHRPLSQSTSPERVGDRIAAASHPFTTIPTAGGKGEVEQPIFDLVYDPRTLTIHSSIPNIPDPGTATAEGLGVAGERTVWSRLEALNVHSQILATVSGTRGNPTEIERTCKTSRGWWVVWMRLPPSSEDGVIASDDDAGVTEDASRELDSSMLREAFLIRRAGSGSAVTSRASGSSTGPGGGRLGSGVWRLGGPSTGETMGGAAAGWGPRGLAEGIGIDARRYIEGLLSLNR